jgi:hypothetical protein
LGPLSAFSNVWSLSSPQQPLRPWVHRSPSGWFLILKLADLRLWRMGETNVT